MCVARVLEYLSVFIEIAAEDVHIYILNGSYITRGFIMPAVEFAFAREFFVCNLNFNFVFLKGNSNGAVYGFKNLNLKFVNVIAEKLQADKRILLFFPHKDK